MIRRLCARHHGASGKSTEWACWSTWASLGGQLASGTGPAVCSRQYLDVFVRAPTTALCIRSGMADLVGVAFPRRVADLVTRCDVAATVRSTSLSAAPTAPSGKRYSGGSWSNWASLGGQIASGTGPAACSWGSRLGLFVEGTNGALYQKTWTGSWSSWMSLGGNLTSSPAATSPTSGVFDVFVARHRWRPLGDSLKHVHTDVCTSWHIRYAAFMVYVH